MADDDLFLRLELASERVRLLEELLDSAQERVEEVETAIREAGYR